MTENHDDTQLWVHPVGLAPHRVEKAVPDAYRLVTQGDGNGGIEYVLQGLFTWTEGGERDGEWRNLETQNWMYARDDVPFGPLF